MSLKKKQKNKKLITKNEKKNTSFINKNSSCRQCHTFHPFHSNAKTHC